MNDSRIKRMVNTIISTEMGIPSITCTTECLQIIGCVNPRITIIFTLFSSARSAMSLFSTLMKFGKYIEVLASLSAV